MFLLVRLLSWLNSGIQIARNRLGLNDAAHELAKEEAAKDAVKAKEKAAGKKHGKK